jgi:hypothetical protein
MGPRLTTTAPEAAPGELFAGDAATLKSEHYPAIFAAFFVGGVIQTSDFRKQTSSASAGCDLNARLIRGSALRAPDFFSCANVVCSLALAASHCRAIWHKGLSPEATALCLPNPYIG